MLHTLTFELITILKSYLTEKQRFKGHYNLARFMK